MIKINKPDPPNVLINNKDTWTEALMDAIKIYGGYDKIPEKIKNNLIKNYKHEDIKNSLFGSSFSKCSFCECKPENGGGNIEVEHFAPKSIYPHLTFEWENLLPVCRKCNGAKGNLDTILNPIINPVTIDPELIFLYEDLRIVPIKGTSHEKIAERTTNDCNLNSPRLYKARSELLIQMILYKDELNDNINYLCKVNTDRKKREIINKIKNSLEKFDHIMESNNCYAGYCRWYIKELLIFFV